MPITPGYKTTEFWLTVAAQVAGVLTVSGVFAPGSQAAQITALAVMVLAALGYSFNRSAVKTASLPTLGSDIPSVKAGS